MNAARITPKTVAWTGAALILLWAASWGLSYVSLGVWSTAIALGIAAAKVVLVVLFFMEVKTEKTSVHAALAAGVSMIFFLIVFMIADVSTREPSGELRRSEHARRSHALGR